MTKLIWLLTAAFMISGCASSSGIVPMGPDTYMISKQGASAFTASGSLKAECFQEAAGFCEGTGKALEVVHTQEIHGGIGVYPQAELQFMCLAPGDPELRRPKPQAEPTQIIETRQGR